MTDSSTVAASTLPETDLVCAALADLPTRLKTLDKKRFAVELEHHGKTQLASLVDTLASVCSELTSLLELASEALDNYLVDSEPMHEAIYALGELAGGHLENLVEQLTPRRALPYTR
ncbi:hypothetical protein [Amycolatopsis sp. NPDC058986]|uniref:hypothetical protein n=1 Tax=unclassified Amycolatopsis TaxID=2618356 RepID=UPI0036707D0B